MGKGATNLLLCFLFLIMNGYVAHGQQVIPPLERKVTLSFNAIPLKEALGQIETIANFSFAYKTGIFDEKIIVNRSYLDKTVREVLDDVFQGSILLTGKGNYILLKANPKKESNELTIEGYIINASTNEKISFATIYETQTLSSAVSDEYGHYILKLDAKHQSFIQVKKADFLDTNFVFIPSDSRVVTVFLKPKQIERDTVVPSSTIDSMNYKDRFARLKWLKFSPERKANLSNFRELMRQKAQFSVVPTIGTHGRLSNATSVNYSINLFGGVVGAVRTFEFASLFNIDVDSVKYAQIAGLFNVVGGNQKGVQIGGLFNSNLSNFIGVQLGGVSNWVAKSFYGVQIGGVLNVNLAKSEGVQLAGITNLTRDSSKVVQIGGIYNQVGRNSSGVQISGLVNYAPSHFKGIQLSGLINVADTMKGVQLGFINYSKHLQGIPIGFLSVSKSGIHQLEIATTESFPIQVGFRTGVNAFYNNLFISGKFTSNQSIVGLGYGIGSSFRLKNDRNRICFDLQSIYLANSSNFNENYLHKMMVTYHFQWKKKLGIAIGPSFNFLEIKDLQVNSSENLRSISPYSIYEKTTNAGRFSQFWIGGFLALRLF